MIVRRPLLMLAPLLLMAGPVLAQEAEAEIPAEAPVEAEVVSAVLPPVIDVLPEPAFPEEALTAGVEGTVVFRISVDALGAVTDAVLIRDPGLGMADAAREAVMAATFEPATRGGEPVPFTNLYFKVPVLHPDVEPPPLPTGDMATTLTQMPQLVESAQAVYPPAALEAGLEATVKLQILIDPRGEVQNVRVMISGGSGFDLAALDAVWAFRFSPGYAGDIPVDVAIDYDYVFALSEQVIETVAQTGYDEIDPEGPQNFTGVVRERGTRTPMPQVEVHIEEFDHSVYTDARGRFACNGIPVGTWHVLILAPGFEPFRTEEDIAQAS